MKLFAELINRNFMNNRKTSERNISEKIGNKRVVI